jgi:hypothetical protein
MKERKIEWERIGELNNEKLVLYNKKTKRIKIESDYMYTRDPLPNEKKEVLKIIDKDFKRMKRWQKVLESIKKKL